MPVPIAEQDASDAQRRDDVEQRVTSSRQSRHRTAGLRTSTSTSASSTTSSASTTLFSDYASRVQQLKSEVNKVFGKEPPGSPTTAATFPTLHNTEAARN